MMVLMALATTVMTGPLLTLAKAQSPFRAGLRPAPLRLLILLAPEAGGREHVQLH